MMKQRTKQIAIPILISLSIGALFYTWFRGFSNFDPLILLWYIGYSLSIGLPNFFMGRILKSVNERYISWIDRPVKGLFITAGVVIPFSTVVVVLVQWIWYCLILGYRLDQLLTPQFIWIAVLIWGSIMIVTLIYQTKSFFGAYKEATVEAEKLKREAISLQYDVAQSQVNPHFLFNAINTAQSLIDVDGEKAKIYLRDLSNFYRELLFLRGEEIIHLDKEIAFVKNYVQLQTIRFGDSLSISFNFESGLDRYIVPMTLQILIENAIKHNEISNAKPLRVNISVKDDILLVSNNLQLRLDRKDSLGIGLKNISNRYRFLSNNQIDIKNGPDNYVVSVPLLIM